MGGRGGTGARLLDGRPPVAGTGFEDVLHPFVSVSGDHHLLHLFVSLNSHGRRGGIRLVIRFIVGLEKR